MAADPAEHGRPDDIDGEGFPVACSMAVDDIPLVLFDLFGRQDDFGKLTDSRVDAVHDLPLLDLVLEQGAALLDPFLGLKVKLDFLVQPGDLDDFLDGQVMSVNYYGHKRSSSKDGELG